MSIHKLKWGYQEKWTCRGAVQWCYNALDTTTNRSYIKLALKDELENAIKESDKRIVSNSERDIEGVCVSIKDLFLIEWEKATGWSNFLRDYISPYTATVVKRIQDSGWIIISKDNCDMFWHGSMNINTHFDKFHNALHTDRFPWWSSWGTAVTVALGGAHFGIASDTWWSIRQPAVFNGLVGFKPSYGAVSRYGLMSYASSLDTVWPIAKDVEDINTIMNVIGWKDINDMTSYDYTGISLDDLGRYDLKWKRVWIYQDFINYPGLDPLIKNHISMVENILKQEWVIIKKIQFFPPEVLVATYYVIAMAETASNLSRLTWIHYGKRLWEKTFEDIAMKSRGYGFSEETKKRIIIGNQILSTWNASHYYKKAKDIRNAIIRKFAYDFNDVDIVLSPITPNFIGKTTSNEQYDNDTYLDDMYTVWFNLWKNPTLALPSIDLSWIQLTWAYKNDSEVIKFWYALERLLKVL